MTDFLDVVRERAARKNNYDPHLTGGAPRLRPVTQQQPFVPVQSAPQPSYSNRISQAGPGPDPARIAALNEMLNEQRAGDSLAGDAGSWALKGFKGLLDVVDAPRAVAMSAFGELGDALQQAEGATGLNINNRITNPLMWGDDGSASFGDISARGHRFNEVTDVGDNPVAGFIGDVAFDPTMYVGVGAIKGGVKGGASALDAALVSGARRGLAEEVTQQAAARGLAGESLEQASRLAADAGRYGRGAFTTKGLQRSGVDRKVLDELGLTAEFGTTLGRLNKGSRATLPFTRRPAEAAENLKGTLKANIADTRLAKAGRNMFVGSNDAIGQAERKFVDQLVTGAPNAAEAARGLVAIRRAKQEAYPWFDQINEDAVRTFGKKFNKLNEDQLADIAYKAEIGDFSDPLVKSVSDWYAKIGQELQDEGIEFGWIDNYVNHRMTSKLRRDVIGGKNQKLVAQGLDASAPFQNTRTLKIGDEFLGHSITDARTPVVEGQQYWTIRQLNEIAQDELGYKAFEDDITSLMGSYMEQALRAKLRRGVYQATDDLGLNEIANKQDSVRKAIEQDLAEAKDLLAQSARQRRKALTRAARTIGARKEEVSAQLQELEARIQDRISRMDELAQRRGELDKALRDKQEQIAMWRATVDDATKAAKRSRASSKGNLTRKIAKLEAEADELYGQLQQTIARMGRVQNQGGDIAQLQQQADLLRQEFSALSERQLEAEAARAALDEPGLPVPKVDSSDVTADDVVSKAVDELNKVAQVRDDFTSVTDDYFDASAAIVWQTTDDAAKRQRLEMRLESFNEVADDLPEGVGVGELRSKANVMIQALQDEGLDAMARAVRDGEAQALAYDMAAGARMLKAGEAKRQFLDSIGNPKFQQHMQEVLGDGFVVIDNQIAVPQWFDEAFQSIPKTQQEWGILRRALEKYDAGMNVWKGYATASPGFVWRNMYSGFFNMYLDNVSAVNVKRFQGFIHAYHQPTKIRGVIAPREHGLENAVQWARKQGYSDAEIAEFTQALEAASVSGWGLTPQEVEANLLDGTTWKPWKADFKVTSTVRGWSTNVEGLLRGAHAYDVIRKGGSVDEAVRRVEKFHFNYRDISEFDRAVKRAIPFWTFYSRNMALQAEMWARFPQKVNRSYYNLKRNLEAQSDPDDVTPSYYDELSAIRTPFGQRNGGTVYFTPDLPTLRFQHDLSSLTTGSEGDPLRLLSDTGPAIKVPIEMLQNRELFTGFEYKNRLHEYDAEGNMVGRDAGILFQAPVIKQAADIAFGDNAEIVNGRLLMQDNVESAIEDFVPGISRLNRLFPTSEKQQQRVGQNWASFLGAPGRVNTPQAIRGELYGRQVDAEQQAQQERYQRLLEMLP